MDMADTAVLYSFCHALRGRGSRNPILFPHESLYLRHALRGRGSRNLKYQLPHKCVLSHALRGRGSRNRLEYPPTCTVVRHALRGRGSRNCNTGQLIGVRTLRHALRGRGSRNGIPGPLTIIDLVTPCEGVGVEIFTRPERRDFLKSRLARAWE